VGSAGTAAQDGAPASPGAVHVMQERAIDLSRHRTRAITQDVVEDASAVIAMSPSHALSITKWWPEHRSKVHVIDEEGIVAPVGGRADLSRECAAASERRRAPIVERLVRGEFVHEPTRAA